jgi:hypothetical protein
MGMIRLTNTTKETLKIITHSSGPSAEALQYGTDDCARLWSSSNSDSAKALCPIGYSIVIARCIIY